MQSSPSVRPDVLYDVVVLGLDRSAAEVTAGLERVFGLDAATAQSVISAMPVTVCHGVNEIRAQYFRRALLAIGARVELRPEGELPRLTTGAGSPANDVEPVEPKPAQPSAASVSPSARAATLLMGSDPLAATINAMPAPQLPAAEPAQFEALPQSAAESEGFDIHLPSLPHESTVPKVALIAAQPLAAETGPRWGELMREPPKPQPVSRPLSVKAERVSAPNPASYGELSLPAPPAGVALVSLSPAVTGPGRERITPALPVRVVPKQPAAAARNVAIPAQRGEVLEPKRALVAAAVPKEPVRVAAPAQDADFWAELPSLLSFPWRGSGLYWFICIGIWALFANLLSALAKYVPFVGTSFLFMLNTSVLALCADYHRRCMWAVASAEGPLDAGPELDPARILHTYMRAGLHLALFMVASQIPLTAWLVSSVMEEGVESGISLVLSRRFWLLAALPSLYWPMAVATASLYNRFEGVWYLPVGLRAVFRAPLEYACIAVIGIVTFVLPWLLCMLLGRAAGLPEMFFMAVAGLPLAASHAVMGALTGLLMRTRPQLFESSAD